MTLNHFSLDEFKIFHPPSTVCCHSIPRCRQQQRGASVNAPQEMNGKQGGERFGTRMKNFFFPHDCVL